MIPISIESVEEVIAELKPRIDDFIRDGIAALKKFKAEYSDLTSSEIKYLNKLIKNLPSVVLSKPLEIEDLKQFYKTPLKKYYKRHKWFTNKIIDCLNYANLRTNFFPLFFLKIGIKACVYCNAQLTVSIESIKDLKAVIKAKFQVDHYLPKTEYPCFSISLFNLYPVCASCNNSKSYHNVLFSLYVQENLISKCAYSFRLDEKSKALYLTNRKIEDLILTFTEPDPGINNKSFQHTFDVTGIYDTQKDLVEELLIKALVYTPSYKETLMKDFPKIFSDINLSNRLIVGNYVQGDEIHRRPMAKFVQDIAKQIKLIEE